MLLRNTPEPVFSLCALALLSGLSAVANAQLPGAQTQVITTEVAPPRAVSHGDYADRTGTKVHWEINDAHALLWNGTPYLPVGGTFTPRSLASDKPEDWTADQKRLALLKERGVLDILIKPERSITKIPVASLQRLVDYLDTNGFRYGLAFGTGLDTPLTSVVVKPNAYRQEVAEGVTSQFNVTDSEKAAYFVIDLTDKEYKILRSGTVNVRENVAVVPVELPAGISRAVTLLYPTKTPSASKDAVLPDLWNGYDDYRDRLLSVLGSVKFGAGLRFFSDPLAKSLSLVGETDYSVPTSEAFRLEFEAFLSRAYASLDDLKAGWDCLDNKSKSFAEIARLVPLWANGRGAPYLFDPVSSQTTHINDTTVSRWWNDFLQFRTDSIQGYMNAMADALKKQVAEVPVVYTWTQTHPIFLNTDREGGFDGLAVSSRAFDDGILGRVLGPAYSLAEQSSRTMWTVMGGIEPGDRLQTSGTSSANLNGLAQPSGVRTGLFFIPQCSR